MPLEHIKNKKQKKTKKKHLSFSLSLFSPSTHTAAGSPVVVVFFTTMYAHQRARSQHSNDRNASLSVVSHTATPAIQRGQPPRPLPCLPATTFLFILHTRLTHPIPYTTHANRHRQARILQEENQTSDENRAGIASRHPRILATLAHPSPLSFESQPPPPNAAGSVPAL